MEKFINDFNEMKKWNVRTDLAYEETLRHQDEEIPGLEQSEETIDGIRIVKNIINEAATPFLNKQPGTYFTLDLTGIDFHDVSICEKVEKALAKVIVKLLEQMNLRKKKCLLVGLGNENVTPDALGPFVIDNVIVTRHLFELGNVSSGFSEVSAISPGVMGMTGIETFDVIKAVTDKIKVDFLIVVDALASNSIARVSRTIQVTDTGISPGSGVGNKRKELSIKTIGVPVIAIGVPTVVDAVTITNDVIEYVLKYLNNEALGLSTKANNLTTEHLAVNYEQVPEPTNQMKETFFGRIGLLAENEKKQLMKEVLTPNGYNMMVTPKEVDMDIEDLAKIIATGIDLSLHEGLLTGHTE